MTLARATRMGLAGITLSGVCLALAPTPAQAAKLDRSLCAPDSNSFTLKITNPYFPLRVGQWWVLTGEDEGKRIGLRTTVLDQTERLYSGQNKVVTRVVEERHWEDEDADGVVDRGEPLVEVTRNFFAQTHKGTVCYFGEKVDIYENGEVVSHQGTWRADAPGNAPGIVMPARPRRGMSFQQEYAPGVAVDQATIVGTGPVKVPVGRFETTIKVDELNPLDGDTSHKVYARGVGLILDEPLKLIRYSRGDD
jgi:hypothetical protein